MPFKLKMKVIWYLLIDNFVIIHGRWRKIYSLNFKFNDNRIELIEWYDT